MAGKYQRYAEYKDSGVDWLGEIPIHWNAKRLGQFFEERREKVSDKDFMPLSVTMNGIVPQLDNAAKTDAGDNRKLVKKGDFVINSRSDRKGSSGVSGLTGSVSLISIVMEPKRYVSSYAHHLLRSQPFQEEFYRFGKGIVADLWSTNSSELKNIMIPELPDSEAASIANFLDHETAKIDALIAKQEKLIELLKEKRQAEISHAVTKGLNPDVPMKDSGVEWLGKVPEHWNIIKFSYVTAIQSGQVDPKVKPYNSFDLIAPNHIESGTGRLISLETAEQQGADSGKYLCPQGCVIYSKIRPALAKVTISPHKHIICSADMYPITGNSELANNFLKWTLLSDWFTSLTILESDRVAMPKINREKLADVRLTLPPKTEQLEIAQHLESVTTKIDKLLKKAREQIRLLTERKSSLISATVTGKIDVRNWHPNETEVSNA